MSTIEIVKRIAHRHGQAVSLTYDPDASPTETWVASVGLSAMGAGPFPSAALSAAVLDLDREGESEPTMMALPF